MGHAGYGAAVSIREVLLQQFVRALYRRNRIPHEFTVDVSGIRATLFLDRPVLRLLAANLGRAQLDLRAWGPLTAPNPFGGPAVTSEVLVVAKVTAPIRAEVTAQDGLTVRLDSVGATVDTLTITSIGGTDISGLVPDAVVRPEVQTRVRALLATLPPIAPALGSQELGSVLGAASPNVGVRVLDGALVLGIDVSLDASTSTHGNSTLLTDDTTAPSGAPYDVAMSVNPVTVTTTAESARAAINARLTPAPITNPDGTTTQPPPDATVDTLTLTVLEGLIAVAMNVSSPQGAATITLDLVPRMWRPGQGHIVHTPSGPQYVTDTPGREEIWLEPTNLVLNASAPVWVRVVEVVAGILTLGLAVIVVEVLLAAAHGEAVKQIGGHVAGAGQSVTTRLRWHFTLPGMSVPVFDASIDAFEVHADELFTAIRMTTSFDAGGFGGTDTVDIADAASGGVNYWLKLPFDVHPADPRARVRWEVRRTDTNAILATVVGPIENLSNFTVTPAMLAPVLQLPVVPLLDVSCACERVLGPVTEWLFGGGSWLRITDRLDRTHPYVRWRHAVSVPTTDVLPDGTRVFLGWPKRVRISDIHRTAFPGRCRMAARYSAVALIGDANNSLEYLDALPFDRAQLDANRAKVCDYCFYGGPTKTAPLIP